jgi:hypothetical protein
MEKVESSLDEVFKEGKEFVVALDKLMPEGFDLSYYEICDAIGLSRKGLQSAQTMASMSIFKELMENSGDGIKGMKALFLLGVNFGIAYASRKVDVGAASARKQGEAI